LGAIQKDMKYLMALFVLMILFGCTYRPKEKRLSQFKMNDGLIIESFYKADSDTIDFKRLILNDKRLTLQEGQVFMGDGALTHQRFLNVMDVPNEEKTVDSLTASWMNEGFRKKLIEDEKDVMFIQIVPDSAMGNIDALRFLNLRQEVEQKIDEELQRKNLGEWFAGDLGAGANMLFFIENWDKASETVFDVLRKEDLIDHVLIAKRIMTAKDDWNYEIVYPQAYEGTFNQM
jgi:hypothetical protein